MQSSLAGSQNRAGITEQALLVQCSAENFLTTQQVFSTAAFYMEQGGGQADSDFSVVLGG
jgi:hypothetical protein